MSGNAFPVVFLFHVPWEGLRHRSHQFAEGLADRGHPVLYVELPWSFGSAWRRDRARLRVPTAHEWQPRPGVTVVRPPLVPPFSNESRAVRAFNSALLRGFLARTVRKLGLSRAVCVALDPAAVRVIGAVEWAATAFDLADDYATWPGVPAPARALAAQEMVSLAESVDVCFAVSRRLAGGFGPASRRMVYLPNAADTRLFSAAGAGEEPAETKGLPRPLVGFAGVLHDFFDMDLVRDVARARPSWSVVLVGPAETDTGPLEGIPNIHLLGGRPYDRLPAFVAAFDVALLPWRLTPAGASANPSKIWQYLAAGRPVVATAVPEVRALRGVEGAVATASGAADFVAAIEHLLDGARDPARTAARVARAAGEDWSARVRRLEAELASAVAARCAPASAEASVR